MESARPSSPYLTQKQAEVRKQLVVGDINYTVVLDLTNTASNTFRGAVQIEFEFNKVPDAELFLDYKGVVESIRINAYPYNEMNGKECKNFLYLPADKLKHGSFNQLVLEFRSTFSAESLACNRYVDPQGRTYIYTAVEPYFLNEVFPLFDQPDLKARLVLITVTPKSWNVNSTEMPLLQTNSFKEVTLTEDYNDSIYQLKDFIYGIEGGCQQPATLTIFKRTPKLPSYLFNFAAGEYVCLESSNTYRGLRMNLYCTHVKKPFLEKQAPLIWQLLNHGIEFFEKFFRVPYPFSKCDVVFVHEFSMAAMENPGLLVFDCKYVFERQMNEEMMVDLGETMLHEVAHCWFGDLVTMKWWDDLWLNESFADYMGFFALEKILDRITSYRYESAMISFFWRKQWGYETDGNIHYTHPIRGPVEHTDCALTRFDGITYAKGASVIKMLIYLIGEDNFSRACQDHFNKHAWKNATYLDFFASLSKHFKHPEFTLEEWQKDWLDTTGFNILKFGRPEPDVVNIEQHQHDSSCCYRRYKLKLTLFNDKHQKLIIPVLVKKDQLTKVVLPPQAKGYSTGRLLNDDDECFVRTQSWFDYSDLKQLSDHTYRPALTRILIWTELFQLPKCSQERQQFVTGVCQNLASSQRERNVSLIQIILDFARKTIEAEANQLKSTAMEKQLFQILHKLLTQQELAAQQANLLGENLLKNSSSKSATDVLLDLFENKVKTANQLDRMDLAEQLLRSDHLSPQQKQAIMSTIDSETPEGSRSESNYRRVLRSYQLGQMDDRQLDEVYDSLFVADVRTNKQRLHDCKCLVSRRQWYERTYPQFYLRIPKLPRNMWSPLFLKNFVSKHLTAEQIYELHGQVSEVQDFEKLKQTLITFIEQAWRLRNYEGRLTD